MSHASFYLFTLFQVFAVKAVGFITRSDKYVVLLAVSEKKSSKLKFGNKERPFREFKVYLDPHSTSRKFWNAKGI